MCFSVIYFSSIQDTSHGKRLAHKWIKWGHQKEQNLNKQTKHRYISLTDQHFLLLQLVSMLKVYMTSIGLAEHIQRLDQLTLQVQESATNDQVWPIIFMTKYTQMLHPFKAPIPISNTQFTINRSINRTCLSTSAYYGGIILKSQGLFLMDVPVTTIQNKTG